MHVGLHFHCEHCWGITIGGGGNALSLRPATRYPETPVRPGSRVTAAGFVKQANMHLCVKYRLPLLVLYDPLHNATFSELEKKGAFQQLLHNLLST
ncbi:MAG: hypothetical protein NT154_14920 [Verrucomicrobia bacterium]|nr:hypothetical protein [Verrucomicrobiota bacterium]